MAMVVIPHVTDKAGFALIAIGIVLGSIGIHFNQKMVDDVKRRVPSKAAGLRNLFETYDNDRVWREHKRLYPKSHVRTRAKIFLTLSAVIVLAGVIVVFFSGRRM
jgi:hypothetical protein